VTTDGGAQRPGAAQDGAARTEAPGAGRVSEEAVRAATGRGWAEWMALLDAAGAGDLDHRGIVDHLERAHGGEVSSWWRQSIAVGYERARGMRVVGQTAGAGFQVGVQRTVSLGRDEAWQLLTTRADVWLGAGAPLTLRPGTTYRVTGADGGEVHGEIRVVRPGDRLRLTWCPAEWDAPATLQLTVQPRRPGRTTLHVHLDRLADAGARERMRAHWRGVLDRLVAEAGEE